MERELVDLRANIERDLPAVVEPSSKRRARGDSDALSEPAFKRYCSHDERPKVPEPKPYGGNTHREFLEFTRACQQVFAARPTTYELDSTKVLYAGRYLRGSVQDAWSSLEFICDRQTFSWTEFKDFLLHRLNPAPSRPIDEERVKLTALMIFAVEHRYLEARQRLSQSVSSFIIYLNKLESQLPERPSETQRARDLFHRLRPGIIRKINRRLDVPTTRTEMEALAIRIEASNDKEARSEAHASTSQRDRGAGGMTKKAVGTIRLSSSDDD